MDEYAALDELKACEKFIVERKNSVVRRYGSERNIKKKELGKSVIIKTRLGVIGFLIHYCNLSIKSRKSKISIYGNRIIINDHRNELIEKKVLKTVMKDKPSEISYKYLFSPLVNYFKPPFIAKALKSYMNLRPSLPNAMHALCEFWVYYALYKHTLTNSLFSGVLAVDDFSAKRVALIMAAKEKSIKTGIVKMSDEENRKVPFFYHDVLFCWNNKQALESKEKQAMVTHLYRDYSPVKRINVLDNKKYVIGIALDSYFNERGYLQLLSSLASNSWVKRIVVRFHPGTKPTQYPDVKGICYEISNDKATDYLKELDLLISGNTSFIKEALLSGVPVAYNDLLDSAKGEYKGTIANEGIVFNMSNMSLTTDVIKEINNFYSSKEWTNVRDSWISPYPDAIILKEALKYLSS